MSLLLAEKIWVVKPEAPFDDDTPTGRYFGTLHKVIDFNFDGSAIWSGDILDSKEFTGINEAENFIAGSEHPGTVID